MKKIFFLFCFLSLNAFAFDFAKLDLIEVKKKDCKTCKEQEQAPTKIGFGKKAEVKKSFFVVAISSGQFANDNNGKIFAVPLYKNSLNGRFFKNKKEGSDPKYLIEVNIGKDLYFANFSKIGIYNIAKSYGKAEVQLSEEDKEKILTGMKLVF